MTIKSFRGKINDGAIDLISLHTNDGSVGYKIKKLQLIGALPGNETVEAVVKIYKIPQTSVDGAVDLSDNTLAGVGFYVSSITEEWATHNILIFDNEVFNQDIYITHHDASTGSPVNYYLELEQIKLDLNENTVATLKDIRNIAGQ